MLMRCSRRTDPLSTRCTATPIPTVTGDPSVTDPHELLAGALANIGSAPVPLGGRWGDDEAYRWGEQMLSSDEARSLLHETSTWEELRARFREVARDPEYHLDPARIDVHLALPGAPALVLDVGCGLGLSSEVLAREGHAVVAIERSAFRAAFSQERLHRQDLPAKVFQTDLESFDAPAGLFDAVFVLGVLEWMGHDRDGSPDLHQAAALKRIADLLRPGGRLVVVIENRFGWPFLAGRPEVHVRKRFIGVVPRTVATWSPLWGGTRFQTYTHSLHQLSRMLHGAGLQLDFALGALPQYHRPRVLYPLRWAGGWAPHSTVVEAYATFARDRPKPATRAIAALHRLTPTAVAAAIAPGHVVSATKGDATPSLLEELGGSSPPTVHVGYAGYAGATTIRRTAGPAVEFVKRPRSREADFESVVRLTDAVRRAGVPFDVPVHRSERLAHETVGLVIEHAVGRPLRHGDLGTAVDALAALHARGSSGDRPFGDTTVDLRGTPGGEFIDRAIAVAPELSWMRELRDIPVTTGLCHGDWMLRNLRRSRHGVVVLDWDLGATAGAQCLDVAWFFAREPGARPTLLRRYENAAGRSVTPSELRLGFALLAVRLRHALLIECAKRLDSVIRSAGSPARYRTNPA